MSGLASLWNKFANRRLRSVDPRAREDERLKLALRTLGLFGLVLLASVALLTNHFDYLDAAADFLTEVGIALLIATILAATVDRNIKSQLARDLLYHAFWGTEAPLVPDEIKNAVPALAKEVLYYYRHMRWQIELDWARQKRVVRVTLSLESTGINTNAETPHRPSRGGWVMPSIPQYQTRYESWTYDIPSLTPPVYIAATRESLDARTRTRPDGGIQLDVAGVIDDWKMDEHHEHLDAAVPFKELFKATQKATVFLAARDVLPLMNSAAVLNREVNVVGSALPDLNVEVRIDGQWKSSNGKPKLALATDKVGWMNQTIIVAWDLKEAKE